MTEPEEEESEDVEDEPDDAVFSVSFGEGPGFGWAVVLLIVCGFGDCAFEHWQDNLTERACIGAGRVLFGGHCSDPPKPHEIRIE